MTATIARRTSFGLLALAGVAASLPARAQPDWVTALKGGGYVIIMRHGATHQDQADTDPLNLANVDKQRQLNDAGRAKAKQIGEVYKKLGIPVGQVITSQYFRAQETGKLAFGSAQPTADVSEGGQVVTHKPNILDAFGKDLFDIREAETVVFKPDGAGGYQMAVRVQADDWKKLAP